MHGSHPGACQLNHPDKSYHYLYGVVEKYIERTRRENVKRSREKGLGPMLVGAVPGAPARGLKRSGGKGNGKGKGNKGKGKGKNKDKGKGKGTGNGKGKKGRKGLESRLNVRPRDQFQPLNCFASSFFFSIVFSFKYNCTAQNVITPRMV